ncbi:hypothetical protein, unlikely [Trypanosoma brucei gambiense DAL972]|uniref:Uncharacterized protein n=2 Tax=Trypanosoma brucei TaxID=5691 RepID=D0A1E7_TRYB9|nr:hypothetical protein, unlikely [Trypanosoma brucei gambiense DAL972]RHW68735.1 hypothetical protein DPX39_100019600 [Trypanosoma brucei equiperdum]CBH15089.1 hypothetical protein, unlikely [Trypanosoma brucei gambiense DAL972]|eukprot:XP_011777355.1 hypothetical protein, unlikely [Trypanosoma brucei gambiense DAL972]
MFVLQLMKRNGRGAGLGRGQANSRSSMAEFLFCLRTKKGEDESGFKKKTKEKGRGRRKTKGRKIYKVHDVRVGKTGRHMWKCVSSPLLSFPSLSFHSFIYLFSFSITV